MVVYARAVTIPVTDNIPWSFQTNSRVMAVGDLHGDLKALKQILQQNDYINPHGSWIAGNDHLVLIGDLVNLGPDSFGLIQFVMKLEREALFRGGKVHVILGNHEIMLSTGKFNRLSTQDKHRFAATQAPGDEYSTENLYKAFTGDSVYAKWLRSLNSIIKINEQLYVHAGLDTWILDSDPLAINSTIRSWLKYHQMTLSPEPMGVFTAPPKNTEFLILPGQGPSGTGALNDEKNEQGYPKQTLSADDLRRILAHLNVNSITVGHMKTHDNKISYNHSRYGSRVIQIDTGISEVENGKLSSLIIQNQFKKAWHQERLTTSTPILCSNSVQGVIR